VGQERSVRTDEPWRLSDDLLKPGFGLLSKLGLREVPLPQGFLQDVVGVVGCGHGRDRERELTLS
jgi:hypothetical protein